MMWSMSLTRWTTVAIAVYPLNIKGLSIIVTLAATKMPTPMNIISAGAVTSVGMSLATTNAAIHAGLDNFQDTAFMNMGSPVIGAAIQYNAHPTLPNPTMRGHERLAAFVRMAIEECLLNAGINLPCQYPIPILLVLGEAERYGRTDELVTYCQQAYAALLSSAHQTPFYRAEVGCVGVIEALQAANKLLENDDTPFVLLVGVDSWLNVPDIQFAIEHERLISPENASGFIPSEGAAAILVANPDSVKHHTNVNPETQLRITGIGSAEEEAILYSDAPCYGKGLAKAIRQALDQSQLSLSDVMLELNDLTSEPYFFEETAYARSRLLRKSMPSGFTRLQPANSTGNLGAAFGPLLLGLAWQSAQEQPIPHAPILISLSSSGEARGAIVATRI